MTDPVPQDAPSGTKWLWVAVLVLLAVAAVIFFLNADGDEDLETIPDEAVTTTEERLNTDLPTVGEDGDLPPVEGMEDGGVDGVDGGEGVADPDVLPMPQETPLADTQ